MATREEIFETLKSQLEERGIESDKIAPEAHFVKDLGLDSLDMTEMTLGLEESYGIEIPDSELESIATVKDAVDLIDKKASVQA
ncbi:MAG: acyl carrier protein [Actinomycetota bacterium]